MWLPMLAAALVVVLMTNSGFTDIHKWIMAGIEAELIFVQFFKKGSVVCVFAQHSMLSVFMIQKAKFSKEIQ